MKKYIFSFVLALVLLPQAASAFSASDSKVTKIGERTAIFQISYELGYGKYAMEAPVGAVRGASEGVYLDYSIRKDEGNGVTDLGHSAGLVFSKATLSDGVYEVEQDEAEKFLLFVVWTVPEGETIHDHYLQVDRLPFNLVSEGNKTKNGLSSGELGSFAAKRLTVKIGD